MTFEQQLAALKSPLKATLRIEDADGHVIVIAVDALSRPVWLTEMEGGWEVVPRFAPGHD